jgi:hypothetical protein
LRKARRKHRKSPEGQADHRDSEKERRERGKDGIKVCVGDQSSESFKSGPKLSTMDSEPIFQNEIDLVFKPRCCRLCGSAGESPC